MTNEEAISKLDGKKELLDRNGFINLDEFDIAINSIQENTKLKAEIEQLRTELEQSVKLPCKVGDKLFTTENGYVEEFKVRSLNHIVSLVEFSRFNETVFLSREEAEQSLKGRV